MAIVAMLVTLIYKKITLIDAIIYLTCGQLTFEVDLIYRGMSVT